MSDGMMPVMSEHQAVDKAGDGSHGGASSYTPTPEERKAIKLAFDTYERNRKYRKQYDEKWPDYYKMFRGRQWKEQRPTYRHSEVINMVFQTIQSQVPVLVDSRPQIEFIPQDPTDREFAEIINEVAESDWQRKNWLHTTTEVVYDSHFYGAGIGSMEGNPDGEEGKGSIDYRSEDPVYFFPDPEARDINDECQNVVFAEPVSIQKLKREYPNHAKHIKADLQDLGARNKTNLNQVRFRSPTDTKTILEGTSAYDVATQDRALKLTVYLRSEEVIEEERPVLDEMGQPIVDPMTGQPQTEFIQRLKYPNGRKICVAGGVLVSDGHIPYDDGKFPYSRLLNYVLPREFWGVSEVEQLESPQKIFNKLISFTLDVLTLMGNPVWVVDSTSGVDTDNLFNRPGLVIEKEPGSQVVRQEGVQLQPYVLQVIDRMREWFDGIAGRSDVTEGRKPEGITAASAIAELQEAAQTRIRQKSRNLDAYLQSLGQLYLARVFQFYAVPRIVRVTGNQNANKYFKFSVEKNEEDGKYRARVTNYTQDEAGDYAEDVETREFIVNGGFDVRVSTGSSLPFAKAKKFAQAKELFELQVIDEEELLKAADYPNWQAVLERVKAKKEAEAMAAAGPPPADGGGAAPPPPAPAA